MMTMMIGALPMSITVVLSVSDIGHVRRPNGSSFTFTRHLRPMLYRLPGCLYRFRLYIRSHIGTGEDDNQCVKGMCRPGIKYIRN